MKQFISTRAPTGGATYTTPTANTARRIFLLAPPREGRPGAQPGLTGGWIISTRAPTGGATGYHPQGLLRICDFYSRPHGRGDSNRMMEGSSRDGFLLAPPREGRPAGTGRWRLGYRFLLAPPREGRRLSPANEFFGDRISTRAPTGGATEEYESQWTGSIFLLAPPREGRLVV